MDATTIWLHTQFQVGTVDPRVFGGFWEHIGRGVYSGVYDPVSPHADEDGFRSDTLSALDRLKYTVMRYPGGNFASAYHWRDGIGPREQRPKLWDIVWQQIETNHFGTDEFLKVCRKLNWAPMLAINLGTGTPEEARDWVEYCNLPTGTHFANMRAANGNPEPYSVKLWCLGNEMDGRWQMGHVPAELYGIYAQQAAFMMKLMDESIELVICGSSGIQNETYMEWDRKVLDYVGDAVDYISLHRYVDNLEENTPDYLAITNSIDQQIEEMDAACRFVQAKRRSKKRAYLCFDEWNAWYRDPEAIYNLEDALVVSGFLNSFVRHADILKIANIAQIVNVIAPILTRDDGVLIQTIFYPLEMFTQRRTGISLHPAVTGPGYEGKTNGYVHFIDTSAILQDDKLHVFITNRSLDETAPVTVSVADRAIITLESAEILTGASPKATNSFEQSESIRSRPFSDVVIVDGKPEIQLPPLCFAALTFRLDAPV